MRSERRGWGCKSEPSSMAYFACLHKQRGEGLGWEVSAEGVSFTGFALLGRGDWMRPHKCV